jgi:hypothetical protein
MHTNNIILLDRFAYFNIFIETMFWPSHLCHLKQSGASLIDFKIVIFFRVWLSKRGGASSGKMLVPITASNLL